MGATKVTLPGNPEDAGTVGAGVVCACCGSKRINPGEECLEIHGSKGLTMWVALDHKEGHPMTQGWTEPPGP